MKRQRNKVATRLSFEARELVCRLLFEGGATYDAVRAELAKSGVAEKDIPGRNAFTAYQKGAEYREYVASRRQWNEKLEKRRWAAAHINDGKGPQSVADMAELAILEQLHELAEGDGLETGKDVATVAKAISAMQRTQIAKRQEQRDRTITDLRDVIDQKDAQILALQEQLEQMAKSRSGAGKITPDVIAQVKAIYGIKPKDQALDKQPETNVKG